MPGNEITQDSMYARQAEDDTGPGIEGKDPDEGAASNADQDRALAQQEEAALDERARRRS